MRNTYAKTMAHELGHGLFGLDHPFIKSYGIPKGETNNLMDYTTKTPDDFLSYHEWAQIDQPVASWSLFNSDEGNMKKNDKFDIEITLFNGYDYKSSKKIDDNKACSKDFNPLVECLCRQYLYLKPGEICMLEFSINNKNINYKDLILDVNNDKINIISSNH